MRVSGLLGPCILLAALSCLLPACGTEEEPCSGTACIPLVPCPDFQCRVPGLGFTPLEVPTEPRTDSLRITAEGGRPMSRFAFRAREGRIYVFSCTARDFERCDVSAFSSVLEQAPLSDGPTEHIVMRPRFDTLVEVNVTARPTGAGGAFTYALAERADDHSGNDAEATPLVPGTGAVTGQLDVGPDRDAFRFDALAGHVYAVRCQGDFPQDVFANLQGPDGQTLAWSSSSGTPAPLWLLETPVGGRAVLALSGLTTLPVDYACTVEDRGADDHAGVLADATPLPAAASMPIQGLVQSARDVDCFSFQARAGHPYTLDCGTTASDLCASTRVLDARGNRLYGPTASWRDETRYVCVEPFSQGFATYDIRLLDLGADQGSSAADAVPMAPGSPVTGYLTPREDVDAFRFEARAGRVYRASVGEGFTVEALRLNAPGENLAALDRTPVGRHFKTLVDEPVLLRVALAPNVFVPTYELRVEELAADAHADTLTDATPVGAGLAASGRLDTPSDVDWFALDLEARAYGFTSVAQRTSLLLVEADGLTLVPWDASAGAYRPRAAGRHYLRAAALGFFLAQENYSFALSAR